jgi:hypothetical protein
VIFVFALCKCVVAIEGYLKRREREREGQ